MIQITQSEAQELDKQYSLNWTDPSLPQQQWDINKESFELMRKGESIRGVVTF